MARAALTLSIIVLGAVLVMVSLSYVYWHEATPSPDLRWVRVLYQIKFRDAAARVPVPTNFIVGGSSVHFGYDAKYVGQADGRQTFNLGSHASLGPEFQLYQAAKLAKPGDRIILAIEYENATTAWKQTNLLKDFAKAFDPEFDLGLRGYFSTRLFSYAREQMITSITMQPFSVFLDRYRPAPVAAPVTAPVAVPAAPRAAKAPIPAPPRSIYDHAAIDRFGDQNGKRTEYIPANDRAALSRLQPFKLQPVRSDLFDRLATFAQQERARGIDVVATWPTIMRDPAYATQPYLDLFDEIRRAYEMAGIPVLGDPQDVMFGFEQMLDTAYHLNENASRSASLHLGGSLKGRVLAGEAQRYGAAK